MDHIRLFRIIAWVKGFISGGKCPLFTIVPCFHPGHEIFPHRILIIMLRSKFWKFIFGYAKGGLGTVWRQFFGCGLDKFGVVLGPSEVILVLLEGLLAPGSPKEQPWTLPGADFGPT